MTPLEYLTLIYTVYGFITLGSRVYTAYLKVYKLRRIFNTGLYIYNTIMPGINIYAYYTREECNYPQSDDSESESDSDQDSDQELLRELQSGRV